MCHIHRGSGDRSYTKPIFPALQFLVMAVINVPTCRSMEKLISSPAEKRQTPRKPSSLTGVDTRAQEEDRKDNLIILCFQMKQS